MSSVSPPTPLSAPIEAACQIATRHGAARLVALGVRDHLALGLWGKAIDVVVVDTPAVLAGIDPRLGLARTLAWQPDGRSEPDWDPSTLTDAVVLCDLAGFDDPEVALAALARAAVYAPAILIVGGSVGVEPDDTTACHDAPSQALREACRASGLEPTFWGIEGTGSGRRPIAIIDTIVGSVPGPAPDGFSVIAIMTSFNEADVIEAAIQGLVEEGVGVYLIDNWSTDDTWDRASRYLGHGLVGIERYPDTRPTTYDWAQLLQRKTELAGTLGADWYIHHDADERRRSPWRSVPIRDALWAVERAGFNVVDHTVTTHAPIDDGFSSADDFPSYFPCFEWGTTDGDRVRLNAWKALARPAVLHNTGGHLVRFSGSRVFPYNFLLEHYPVRSQAHGQRKIHVERKSRWNARERAKGWHIQYDAVDLDATFLRAPAELMERDDAAWERHDLLTRLLRAGTDAANTVAKSGLGRCPGSPFDVDLSAVILAGDDHDRLAQALAAVARATSILERVDLIVVAGGSGQDGTEPPQLDRGVRWVRRFDGVPPSLAWGHGIAAARGGHVLLVSDDTIVDDACLAPLLEAIEQDPEHSIAAWGDGGCVGGSGRPSAGRDILRFGLTAILRAGLPCRLEAAPDAVRTSAAAGGRSR